MKRDLEIERRITALEMVVKELAQNHIPSLEKRILKLEKSISKAVWILVINLIGVITLLLEIVLK